MYLKKAQSEKPCLYEIPYDTSDPANSFVPDREDTLTLEKESRSKLNKDLMKPYDYTKQNSTLEACLVKYNQGAEHSEMCKVEEAGCEGRRAGAIRSRGLSTVCDQRSPRQSIYTFLLGGLWFGGEWMRNAGIGTLSNEYTPKCGEDGGGGLQARICIESCADRISNLKWPTELIQIETGTGVLFVE
ncbi:hypothetical protein Tco_0454148 [Tanacetum coccineum]